MWFCIILNKFLLNVCLFLDWWHGMWSEKLGRKMAQFCRTPQTGSELLIPAV